MRKHNEELQDAIVRLNDEVQLHIRTNATDGEVHDYMVEQKQREYDDNFELANSIATNMRNKVLQVEAESEKRILMLQEEIRNANIKDAVKDDEITTLRRAVEHAELVHGNKEEKLDHQTQLSEQLLGNWEQQLHTANTLSLQRLVEYNEDCYANKQLNEAWHAQQTMAM